MKISRNINIIIIAIFNIVFLYNCDSLKRNTKKNQDELQRKWMLVELNNTSKEALTKHKPYIDLTGNSGTAHAGCNSIQFGYSTEEKSTIKFSNFVSTRMHCENISEIENSLVQALENSKQFKIENQTLTLTTKSNSTIKFVAED